ncbi:purine nucleoside phosphorylase LACC1-like [Gigantopelta aegis]|uniref:purine nucleoside phosphorylase LACC1-like n=1 Tax=Gigantopelta aegis TaxID=1735272 RepID=UPI001B8884F6|nr:purine nucleoside phosphorylase LACC1-like [Gigantopelta aegis]XP_041374135.1 purine nucleoside phosphorylase LACC1-like [Gigantopelta aegis]
MSKRNARAVVVDCFQDRSSIHSILTNTEELISGNTDIDNHVFFITPINLNDVISSSVSITSVFTRHQVVTSSSKIGAFYKAKTDFDLKDIEDILIVCCLEGLTFWTNTCEILLTPVHQWQIKTLPEAGTTTTKTNATTAVSKVRDKDDGIDDLKVTITNYLQSIDPIGQLNILHSPLFEVDQFVHGFTTRTGGITTIPPMSSLNLHYTVKKRDPPIVIKENLRRVATAAGFDLKTFHPLKPEHGNAVWVMDKEEPVKYDGIVTNRRGVTLAAPGADCIPVIFADPVKMICGAVHAGYRGTVMAAVVETLRVMVSVYNCDPKDVRVAMGPALRPCCAVLEPDDPTVAGLAAISPSCVGRDKAGKPCVDMFKANTIMLLKEGILPEHIDDRSAGICTFCNKDKCFSHQRDGIPFGNQVGFIRML